VDPKRKQAAEILASGGTQADAAKAVGVNRSTVMRWLKDPEFVESVDGRSDAAGGLTMLVPEALLLLQQALSGDVSAARARIALDVIKAAAGLNPVGAAEGTLISRIAELDERGTRSD